MRRLTAYLTALLLAVSCGRRIDPSRVVTNPIDVDYAFTHALEKPTATRRMKLACFCSS